MNIHPAKLGAILAFLAVALGAFGAHLLSDVLSPEHLHTFETAVRYQMYHGLGLIALGALPKRSHRAAPFLLLGSILFSGSLYLLVASNMSWWGAVAPIGGVLQLIGWALVFFNLPNRAD